MKKLLLVIASTLALSGCGISSQLAKNCGGDLQMGCKQAFGDVEADTQREESQTNAINELAARTRALEIQMLTSISTINILEAQASVIRHTISIMHSTDSTMQQQLTDLQVQQAVLQAQVVAIQTELATQPNSGNTVTDYLDCGGNLAGYDEIVLRLSDGSLLAYFKDNGSREFLSLLEPGSYQTTDQSKCNFTITNSGQFCDDQGCR